MNEEEKSALLLEAVLGEIQRLRTKNETLEQTNEHLSSALDEEAEYREDVLDVQDKLQSYLYPDDWDGYTLDFLVEEALARLRSALEAAHQAQRELKAAQEEAASQISTLQAELAAARAGWVDVGYVDGTLEFTRQPLVIQEGDPEPPRDGLYQFDKGHRMWNHVWFHPEMNGWVFGDFPENGSLSGRSWADIHDFTNFPWTRIGSI